jgi:signal transduction histidine kinase
VAAWSSHLTWAGAGAVVLSALHPYVLDHAGLQAALTALAESAARRSGARVDVEVDDAGPSAYDQLGAVART